MLLENKMIIITGGSVGIGLAVAIGCARQGARVVVAARNERDLSRALTELNGVSQNNHLSYSLDVSDIEAVKRFAQWVTSRCPEINGLINCAGIYGPIGKTTHVDLQEFTRAIQINFLGTVYMCTTFAPLMSSQKNKKIVNYSGGGAASPFPNYSAYAAGKTAIVRFTENLALELSSEHFDVNCVAPGFVITRLHQQTLNAGADNAGQAFFENTIKQIQSGGVPAEKAAELTMFLLSEVSDGITGKFISAPWDPWREQQFQERLRTDKDFATLRRIDDKYFQKRNP